MLPHAGSGHPGGSLSVIDVLTALYFGRLRHDPKHPDWPDRDRVVLSKGHAVPALYTVMAPARPLPPHPPPPPPPPRPAPPPPPRGPRAGSRWPAASSKRCPAGKQTLCCSWSLIGRPTQGRSSCSMKLAVISYIQ